MVWNGEELSPAQTINFGELLEKHRAVNAGKSPETPMKGVKRVLKNGGELHDRSVG